MHPVFREWHGNQWCQDTRPVIQEELDKYYGETAKLYRTVKPGITGLWQVSGRSDIGYDERVALDATYIKYRSMWGDIVILWKTIGVVLMKKGAYWWINMII